VAYLKGRVLKSLPAPINGSHVDTDPLAYFDMILTKDGDDTGRGAKAAREKDEKFGMYLNSLSRAKSAIQLAEERLSKQETGETAVKDLVDGAGDALGPYLGETVS